MTKTQMINTISLAILAVIFCFPGAHLIYLGVSGIKITASTEYQWVALGLMSIGMTCMIAVMLTLITPPNVARKVK